MSWTRVSRQTPCAICHKPDWCTYDGEVSCCMRVESARQAANGGWIHGDTRETRQDARRSAIPTSGYEDPAFDAALWWRAARHAATPEKLNAWAAQLGLPAYTLDYLGACTVGEMLCFPMYDGAGKVCGIRTRNPGGQKRAVMGSKAGVFLSTCPIPGPWLLCEGPTDAAAGMALGFEPIGRPSCAGCERHVVDTCKRLCVGRITICADNDGPGIAGTRRIADMLVAAKVGVRMVTAGGHKDLRVWLRQGATPATVAAAWGQAVWR